MSSLVGVEDRRESTNPCGVRSMGVRALRSSATQAAFHMTRKYPGGKTCSEAEQYIIILCVCLKVRL